MPIRAKKSILSTRFFKGIKMKRLLLVWIFCCVQPAIFSWSSHAAVILQYHHVSDDTPRSTSISVIQFEAHLQYLADNEFDVVSLSTLMNAIRKQQPIPDKTIAITFDDGYLDILVNAKPLLDKFNYPFSIFINPNVIEQGYSGFLTWQQLKGLADEGTIIANHGYSHHSFARLPTDSEPVEWINQQGATLNTAEAQIKEKIGQSWRYFAYPYGEYTPEIQLWLKENDFIAFSQQSGAVGLATNLTSVPRFPVSHPYDQITSLHDKVFSLPFTMQPIEQDQNTVYVHKIAKSVTFKVIVDDFEPDQLNCYVSGLGRQPLQWLNETSFTINFSEDLGIGRGRINCTAPSIVKPSRYYWYSKPWFVLNEKSEWFPL
jgi:peptidoglycan/xylan/chitin deacetylase (PgdA/CDA1 family)